MRVVFWRIVGYVSLFPFASAHPPQLFLVGFPTTASCKLRKLSRFENLGSAQRLQLLVKRLVTIVSDWIFLCRRVLFVFCCRTHRSSAGVPRGPGWTRAYTPTQGGVVVCCVAEVVTGVKWVGGGGGGGVTSHGCGAA